MGNLQFGFVRPLLLEICITLGCQLQELTEKIHYKQTLSTGSYREKCFFYWHACERNCCWSRSDSC